MPEVIGSGMLTASTSSAVLFSLLVLVVAGAVAVGLLRARVGVVATLAILLAYLAVPSALARLGMLNRYAPLPAPPLLLILGLTLLTVAIVSSLLGARLAVGVALGAVVALQGFRIAVELILHRLYLEGVVPIQMTYSGRNFDLITGVTGLLLGIWLLSGRLVPRSIVLGWNLLGLALLVNIVMIAVLSTPVSFRVFTEGPPNLLPSTFPYIWLPSFLVQVALGSHLLIFRQLRAGHEQRGK
jgi:hypothetical protein